MGIIIATLIVLGVIASVLAQDFSVFSWAYWQEGGNALRSEVVRNLGLLAAAAIGLVVGSWRAVMGYMQARASQQQAAAANAQADIAQQGHITERFSRAVEQLGHDRVAVRIGGLYALKRIAEDSVERDHLAVMDVLTSFIRQPPYAAAQRLVAEREMPEWIDCPDIVAAIEIIQGRSEDQKAVEKKREYGLSLSRASLSYLQHPEIDLQKFNLAGARLLGANLGNANLLKADLTGADLTGADLTGAELPNAILTYAKLTGTRLEDTILTGAKLMSAKLTGANLSHADLKDTRLTGADLSNAKLWNADLTDAKLTNTNFTDADLTGADLTQEQLDRACIIRDGKPPTLSKGLKPPQNVCP